MALPLLKDMLPEGLEEALSPAPLVEAGSPDSTLPPALIQKVQKCEQNHKELRAVLHEFVDNLQHPEIKEDDIESAFDQVSAEERKLTETVNHYARTMRQFRSQVLAMPNSLRKFAMLRVCESQLRMYSEIRAMFQTAKNEIEMIRDSLLVREAQELAASTFWGDDDD